MTDRVRAAVEQAIPELMGAAVEVQTWSGPQKRDWSWQYRLRVSGPAGGDLILKIPRWEEAPTLEQALDAGEQPSTRAELDVLRQIEGAVSGLRDPGLAAVEPIGYVAAVNGILMRRLEGASLRDRLGRGSGSGDVAALFERVGRWLRVFHSIDGPPQQQAFDAGAEIEVSRRLEHEVREAGSPPRALVDALEALRLAAEHCDGISEPWTGIHGDLNAGNVLVGHDDRIAVIDPNREPGPALADPAQILTDVQLHGSQLVTGGMLRTGTVVAEWEERLLGAGGFVGEPMLEYRMANAAVQRWARLEIDVRGVTRLGLIPGRNVLRRVIRSRLAPIV